MIATKATASKINTAPISHGRPVAKPARIKANSEMKRPNGGKPMVARNPTASMPAVPGIDLSNPDTPLICVVW